MGIHFLKSSSLRWRSVIIFGSILCICFLIILVQDGVFNQTSMLIAVLPPFKKHVDNTSDVSRTDGNNESMTFENQVNCTISSRVVVDGRPLCTPTSMKPDNGSSLFYCNWTKTPDYNYSHRLQASLSCNTSNPDITFRLIYNDTQPDEYEYNDTCLDAVIKSKCYDGNAIPRLVHFVNFGHHELPFYGLLSIMSAFRFVQNTWQFHNVCGSNILLTPNRQTAEVIYTADDEGNIDGENRLVMSTEEMSINGLYEIVVEETEKGYSGIQTVIGVCEENPLSITLPPDYFTMKSFVGVHAQGGRHHCQGTKEYSCPALMTTKVGSRLGVLVDASHSLHVYVDGRDQGVMAKNVAQKCYAVFDLRYFLKKISTCPVIAVE